MQNNVNCKSDIGNYYDFLVEYSKDNLYKLSYMTGRWTDFEEWKVIAKAKVFELLNYFPEEEPLNPRTLSRIDKGELIQEEIEFNVSKNVRVKGTLLIPKGEDKTFPAVIALHDHSGVYYYGREKIVEQQEESEVLKSFKDRCYGGHSWANETAKRGYVVLAIDAFYFGSRKLDIETVSNDILNKCPYKLDGLKPGTPDYINTFNQFCIYFETLLAKHIFVAGTTWPGIFFHDDRKSVDYLCTRKEVDKDKIGCCGLSLGGFRSIFLAALDSRIKCSVVAGWMPTYDSIMFNRLRDCAYSLYIPNLTKYLDITDVAGLAAPNPLYVQQCVKDPLYTLEGMQEACSKIEKMYSKLGISEKYDYQFYDNEHQFNLKMQEDAFGWLDKWLE